MVLRPRLARRSQSSGTVIEEAQSGGGVDRRARQPGMSSALLAGCSTGHGRTGGPTTHDLSTWDASSVSAISKKTNTPEFLLKLYRILQQEDPNIIQWDNGRIHVRNPHVLGQDVLHKYFRHSKYSSFQRQLNYFGFRKTQGKGKMSACTYTNAQLEGGTLRSLLGVKRKTSGTPKTGTSSSDTDERDEADTSMSDDDSSMEAASIRTSSARMVPSTFKRQRSTPVSAAEAKAAMMSIASCHRRNAMDSECSSTTTSPLTSCCPSASSSRESSSEIAVGAAFFGQHMMSFSGAPTVPTSRTSSSTVGGQAAMPSHLLNTCRPNAFEAPMIDVSAPTYQGNNNQQLGPSPRSACGSTDDLGLLYGFSSAFDLDDMSWCESPIMGYFDTDAKPMLEGGRTPRDCNNHQVPTPRSFSAVAAALPPPPLQQPQQHHAQNHAFKVEMQEAEVQHFLPQPSLHTQPQQTLQQQPPPHQPQVPNCGLLLDTSGALEDQGGHMMAVGSGQVPAAATPSSAAAAAFWAAADEVGGAAGLALDTEFFWQLPKCDSPRFNVTL